MGKFAVILTGLFVVLVTGCDLQPKITSLPDSVGDFISTRYPALLADPDTEPEIYNSAVTDYGVYAAPELYGIDSAGVGDYMLYADAGDYAMPAQEIVYGGEIIATPADIPTNDIKDGEVILLPVEVTSPTQSAPDDAPATDTPSADAIAADTASDASDAVRDSADADVVDIISIPERDSYLSVPMYGTPVADTAPVVTDVAPVPVETKSETPNAAPAPIAQPKPGHVIVARGDTLYGIARANGFTVEQVAAANKLSAPYNLRVGQDLILPEKALEKTPEKAPEKVAPAVAEQKPAAVQNAAQGTTTKPATQPAPAPVATSATSTAAPAATVTAPKAAPGHVTVARGDTLYGIAHANGLTVEELAAANKLSQPYSLRVGQDLIIPDKKTAAVSASAAAPAKATPAPSAPAKQDAAPAKNAVPAAPAKTAAASTPAQKQAKPAASTPAKPAQPTTTTQRYVKVRNITVAPGDTLYSISRANSVPVNDLAVLNKLSAPFALYVGQKLVVPDNSQPAKTTATKTASKTTNAKASTPAKAADTKNAQTKKDTAKNTTTTQTTKISSDPKKKLPAIAARSSSKFSWPVRGKILSSYGAKTGGLFNDGINISASRGATVSAAENGVVAYAGNEVKGMGNLVIIQHADGWMTVYAHMDSMAVRRGARVSVGQKIGTVGQTGKVDKPQLHFEIRKGTKAYNPSSYLKK